MKRLLLTAIAALFVAAPVSAQGTGAVTQSDITRLQDSIYLADRDLSSLRSRDAARASQLQSELDELREDVIYLKVKLRRERTLARSEYSDVRDRIEDLRTRARGDATGAYSAPPAAAAPVAPAASSAPAPAASTPAPVTTARSTPPATATAKAGQTTRGGQEIPVGTQMDVRLLTTLNSGQAQVEDRFEASTLVDLTLDGRTVVPAGSLMRGVVSSVEPATRTNRTARMTVSFDQLTVNGRDYPIKATVTEAIQGEGIKGEAGRVGVGAGVGAIIGGILGGFKGALAGILIGGGGTIAATEGKEVELPQGTVLRVRFDSPATVGAR
jgi:TolA-binding protein